MTCVFDADHARNYSNATSVSALPIVHHPVSDELISAYIYLLS